MNPHDVDIDDRVFAIVRQPDDCPPDWVRIVMLQARLADEGEPVYRDTSQVFVWDRATQQVAAGTIEYSASRAYDLTEYFSDEFDVADWTRVVLTCDIDGTQRAIVTVDPAGPPQPDYVGGSNDPIYDYLDEHRAELEELARTRYGAGR